MPKLVFNAESQDALVVRFDVAELTVGSAPDNVVAIQGAGLARHHARFERKGELAYVVDLETEAGTFVDGTRVQRFVLGHRAVVRMGHIDVLYLEEEPSAAAPVARHEAVVLKPPGSGSVSSLSACTRCQASLPAGAAVCGRCGQVQPAPPGAAPAPADLVLRPEPLPRARGAGILPLVGFFLSLFGPLVLGIGWLLGIILGFVSLSLIRQRGGLARDRRVALWSIGLGFLWLAALLAGAFAYAGHRREARQVARVAAAMQANENEVVSLLRDLAVVEEYLKSAQALPLAEGGSAYASLKELQTLPNPFLPAEQVQETVAGYRLTVKAQGADGFTATAAPLVYGQTGRKTFSMDQTGVLTGADIGGRQPWEIRTVLPELDGGRSVYLDARERIARELLKEVRQLAESRHFDRSQFILRELERRYVLTDAFTKSEAVAKGLEQLAANAKAQEAADKALASLNEGKQAEALAAFKAILEAYPGAANTGEVQARIAAIEGGLAAERNQLAEAKWKEAQALDKDGHSDQAVAAYRALAASFADTAAVRANLPALERALARLEEARAGALFAALNGLDVSSNATRVLELVTALQRDCPKAPTVTANAALLQALRQQAQSQADADEGVRLAGEQRYLEAADRFDRILAASPALAQSLAPTLAACYFQAGESLLHSNRLAEAATAYDKFLQFTRSPEQLDPEKLRQLYLSLGEIHFYNKNYTNAAQYFRKGARFFGDDPKPYRLYGQALLRQRKFQEALPVYNALVALPQADGQARFERGLCLLGAARQVETNLVEAMKLDEAAAAAIAAEGKPSALAPLVLPPTIRDEKLKDKETDMFRDKQFEMRLADAMEKMKAYAAKTPEATIIREAIRLVSDIQLSASELDALAKDATADMKMKLTRARGQFLSVFTTQQDYFDKIIADRIAAKQAVLSQLDLWRNMTTTASGDLDAASTLEAYRGVLPGIQAPLAKKAGLVLEGCAQLRPALENEVKFLDEARSLIRLAVSQFKGWTISWNLNDRIEKFFFINYTENSARKADAERKVQEAIGMDIPFEKALAF